MPLLRRTMFLALDGLLFIIPKTSSILSLLTGSLGKNLDNLFIYTGRMRKRCHSKKAYFTVGVHAFDRKDRKLFCEFNISWFKIVNCYKERRVAIKFGQKKARKIC